MKILSPAKINLFLHVTGKRPDGYHELVSLMCCLELYDTIEISPGGRGLRVRCSHPQVPEDDTNLVHRAARLFFRHLETAKAQTDPDLLIRIEKNIPVAAGLGGGSSNAAATLLGLNRLYKNPYTVEHLSKLALHIGADVPFFLYGRPAIVTGVGERLEPYHGLKTLHVLLVYPQVSVSTAEVYKNLDLGLTKCEKQLNSFLLDKRAFDPSLHLCNDLEAVSIQRYPAIAAVKAALSAQDAVGVLMSGSGSSVFGIFFDSDATGRAAAYIADKTAWQVYVTQTSAAAGCRVIEA